MFYAFKVKLISGPMRYIFSFLPDGQPLRHNGISHLILSPCPSPKTDYYIYFSS
ncbi:hypothetical protein C0J52_13236 [Blattella germanica]|nr:hypothetical protein C0J52_13236 [Blattella germanica]